MKRILIIGSNGLVGQAIVNLLQNSDNYRIIACSKNQNINQDLNSQFEILDITNHSQTNYIISLYNPDVVINTAAISSIDICKDDKEYCLKTNLRFTTEFRIVLIEKEVSLFIIPFSITTDLQP